MGEAGRKPRSRVCLGDSTDREATWIPERTPGSVRHVCNTRRFYRAVRRDRETFSRIQKGVRVLDGGFGKTAETTSWGLAWPVGRGRNHWAADKQGGLGLITVPKSSAAWGQGAYLMEGAAPKQRGLCCAETDRVGAACVLGSEALYPTTPPPPLWPGMDAPA